MEALDITQIGYGIGEIILQGVGVKANETRWTSYEREVFLAEHDAVNIFPAADTVVVAQYHDIRNTEFVEDPLLPFKLFSHAEIGKVAAMHDEIEVVPEIDMRHFILGLIVPPLCVADDSKTDLLFPACVALYFLDVTGIDILLPVDFAVIRMHIDEVTRYGET